ncbi:MAG TPA: nucleotide exchange factor GrpE [Candidatus Eisenbacteria bacterium]|nr:nucleotide exchange factor GrpE [Candidatus Eisenbacteria bacterium]
MDEIPEEKPKPEDSESLERTLEKEKKRSEEYLTQLKYARADLENLKKRYERQLDEVREYSNERIMIELLDVVDELELAVQSTESSDSSEALVQGVKMTLKKLKKILENEGVSPIKCVGEPFDPSKHNAVAKTEDEGVDGCRIIEEVRKGYTMREKVIRPSIVKIVVQPSNSKEGDE